MRKVCTNGKRVVGVETDQGYVQCEKFINCGGQVSCCCCCCCVVVVVIVIVVIIVVLLLLLSKSKQSRTN